MRILIFFLFMLITVSGFGQFNAGKQGIGNSNNRVIAGGGLSADSGFIINPVYADTTAANFGKIKFYGGGLIRTADNSAWYRNITATKWIKLETGAAMLFNVQTFGAKGDGVIISDASITSGTDDLTTVTGVFSAADVGKYIQVQAAGSGGYAKVFTISAYVSPTAVTLSANADATVSGGIAKYGTDQTTFIQAAINTAETNKGGTVYFPNGLYILAGALQSPSNSQLVLPTIANPTTYTGRSMLITLRGETRAAYDATILAVTVPSNAGTTLLSFATGSGAWPAVIGSATTDNASYTYCDLVVQDMNIQVMGNTSTGAALGGINAGQNINFSCKNLNVQVDVPLVNSILPANNYAGIIFTKRAMASIITAENIQVSGFRYGVITSEHFKSNHVQIFGCFYGYGFTKAGHLSILQSSLVQWCKYSFASVINYPATETLGANKLEGWVDIETINEGSRWYNYSAVVQDTANYLYGRLHYNFTYSDAGSPTVFVKNGGTHLQTIATDSFMVKSVNGISPNDYGELTLPVAATPNLQEVTDVGATTTNSIEIDGLTANGDALFNSNVVATGGYLNIASTTALQFNGGAGTAGYMASSNGAGSAPSWISKASVVGSGLTLGAIGSSANANGATINSGTGVLNLEPASASFGGVVTTGTQTMAGAKTFTTSVTTPLITGGANANDDVTIQGTSHGTTATSYVIMQPSGGNVGIGTSAPSYMLQMGSNTSSGVATPVQFSMGGTYNNTTAGDGSKAKWLLYTDGTQHDGIGFSTVGFNAMEYITMLGTSHAWYVNSNASPSMVIGGTSGAVGIGTTSPAASALLDVSSVSKGLLIPRMSRAQITAISSPATGLLTYDNVMGKMLHYNGSSHVPFLDSLTGNINIYNTNGTLTGDRTLSGDGNDLIFNGVESFNVTADVDFNFVTDVNEIRMITGDRILLKHDTKIELDAPLIGLNKNVPTSTVHVGGSFAAPVTTSITSTYAILATDYTIECTSGTFTATLPTAVGITGRIYNIVNSGAGIITIGTTSSQTFVNVAGTPTSLAMAAVGTKMVQSNGTGWMVLASF